MSSLGPTSLLSQRPAPPMFLPFTLGRHGSTRLPGKARFPPLLGAKPRVSDRVPKCPEFRAFWRVIDIFLAIFGICAIMPSKNDNAASGAQLNEVGMGKQLGSWPKRQSGAREVMWANRAGKRKNALGGPRKLDKARFSGGNGSFSLGWIWPDLVDFVKLAQFGFRLDFPWMLSPWIGVS